MGGAEDSVSTLCTFPDFYLSLVLAWVFEQKYLCGWSTSSVLLERALWFGSLGRNPATTLECAPKRDTQE